MFAKFVVLILVFGASGIGVLSVRQSRLQAVHEMAESRHRTLQLNEQAGEIRTLIVRSSTPQRVHQLIKAHGEFVPASATPAQIEMAQQVIEREVPSIATADEEPAIIEQPSTMRTEEADDGSLIFTLEDGTRVVFVRD